MLKLTQLPYDADKCNFLPLIAAGVGAAGAIGGSLLSYFGQKDTNNMNMEMMRETNAFNKQQNDSARTSNEQMAQRQEDFQREMSNSAYQRATTDMRAAGINPMLAYSQGGASSPSGASVGTAPASSSAPPRLESGLGALGEGISKIGPSALAVASGIKDLESKDAGIAATKAGAIASAAQAKNSLASAKATEIGMPSVMEGARSAHERSNAEIQEAKARAARAGYDEKFAPVDAFINRLSNTVGIGTDALSLKSIITGDRNRQRNQTMKEETHLRNQGRLGTGLK